jgi:ATP-dependent protease ClpP protease subunit
VEQSGFEEEPQLLDLSETPVYVSFSAEINASTCESLLATMANLTMQGASEVHLLLSTPGGAVMNGMNLYNVLRALPFKLITHNVGNVDSVGNVVFLSGEERFACPHSTFMFHGVMQPVGDGALDEKFLRESRESLLADQKRMAGAIEDRSSLSAEEVQGLFLQTQTKDATFAVSAGLVDEIKDVDIPPGAAVVALVFER